MGTLPFTLPTCDQPATVRLEVYAPANGLLHGSLDAVVYTCDQHSTEAVEAIQAAKLTAYRSAAPGVEINRTCGYAHVFVEFAEPAVVHPEWCVRSATCDGDGIHTSKPLTVVTGDAYDLVRVWLEMAWSLDQPSIVLEITSSGEVTYLHMPTGQGQELVHQLGRLIELAGGAR